MNNNKKNRSNYIIVALLLLVVGVSIGYAALSTTLNINGSSSIGKASWDVHFENLTVTVGSATATTPAAIDTNTTTINYAVTLAEPGDFYEFTVDVKNGGTLAAKLGATPTITELTTTQKKYANYTVTYADGTTIAVNDTLAAGETKTVKVRVEYKSDISSDDLTAVEDTAMSLSFSMNYIQG